MSSPPSDASRRLRFQLIVAAVLVGLVIAIPQSRRVLGHGIYLLGSGQLAQFHHYLLSLGRWAPFVSIALLILAVLLPIPATLVMVANGLVFGVWTGALVSLTGTLLGAIAAYSVGRSLGRSIAERFIPRAGLEHADRLMAKYGGWAIVIGHWVPGIPGDPLSYAAGITRMSVFWFLLATTAIEVPANLITAFAGHEVAGDIPLKYWLGGWGAVLAVYLVWRIARKRQP